MRLHAYLTQALLPGEDKLRFVQLPGIQEDELKELAPAAEKVEDVVNALEEKGDERVEEVKKAVVAWLQEFP